MDFNLKSKVAVVTAASQGIGKAAAEALGAEGCKLVLSSRRGDLVSSVAEDIASRYGVEAVGTVCDLTSPSEIDQMLRVAKYKFGRVDVLVTNTGGPPFGSIQTLTDEQWETAFHAMLMNVVRLTRGVLPMMREIGGGSIINVTAASVKEPLPNLMLSNAFRPAIAGVAKTLSIELGPDNIRVNNVAPSRIDTELMQKVDSAKAIQKGTSVKETRINSESEIPLRRYGRPLDVGRVIAFLASDVSSYITGSTIFVDGGRIQSF